jgi:DNA-directed RNA polymerase specialized sigma24 family protein
MADWQEILNREGAAVWRTVYRILGDRADAEDCYQETFLAALEVSRHEAVRSWPALLRRLATTKSVERLRQRCRRRRREEKTGPESMRLGANIVRAGMFVLSLKGAYRYRPEAVNLGDSAKILFWYRPAGATKYRALYGDLHWADLTTDQLPEIPKP